MSDRCGNCGAMNDAEAETCTACGALLAAYQSPAGATEPMPEPDLDSPPSSSADILAEPKAERPVSIEAKTTRSEKRHIPASPPMSAPDQRDPPKRTDRAPASSGTTAAPAPTRGDALPPPRGRSETIRPDPVPAAPSGARFSKPAPPPAALEQDAMAPAPSPSRLDEIGRPRPQLVVMASIVTLLVSCALLGISSSERVSEVYGYLGLCLGPLGLIGLLIGVGLMIMGRSSETKPR